VNRKKVWHIIRREYVESVRKKSFLFGLVATPLLMLGLIALPLFTENILADEVVTVAVLDESNEWGNRLRESVAEEPAERLAGLQLLVYTPPELPTPAILGARVTTGDLTAWILLPEDFERTGIFEYHSESITNLTRLSNLESRLERLLVRHKAARFGMAEADVDALLAGVQLKTFQIGEEGGREASFDQVYFHAIALVMILFFALLPTGQILMRSVIEEKSSRVIEVLISSVTPRELMVGKIVGLGAVGLTLIGTWTAIGALIAARLGADFPIGGDDLAVFVLYFVPGYFFYAALLGSVGSICTAERDAQPFLTRISLTLILPVMLGFAIAQSPDHVLVRTASFVPFFTPSLMLFRFTIKQPPLWELGATWLSLVAGTAAMFWASSRIFRVGILLTGKRPTIPEIARWVWAR
jgi:ABC-2 type transport system permease protein